MQRRWPQRLAKVVVAMVAAALLLPLAAVEGLYRYGLHLVGELPAAPAARLPERLERALWEEADGGPFDVAPQYPWHTVFWLAKANIDASAALHDAAPGEHACGREAQLWLIQHPVERRSLRRTIAEWALAKWCTRHWTAAQVTQAISEQEYFGRHLHGLAEAAQGYFGKSPEQLAAHELALLVGLPQSPGQFNPDRHPDRALKRRSYILGRFRETGLLSEVEYQQAMNLPLGHLAAPCAEDGQVRAGSQPFAEEPSVRDAVWGMTLDQVRRLHPGGSEGLVEQDTVYRISAPALGLPAVMVSFFFEPRSGLSMVSFSLPAKGGKVDPVTGEVSPMTKSDARAMRASLRDRLAVRLGKPTFEIEGSDMGIQWQLPGEMVGLLLPHRPQSPDEAGVSITYFKVAKDGTDSGRTPR